MSKKCLAIIPARGGSKRIPKKNIKLFLGKPIIKYSIDAAIKSNCFDEIMVSTDDKKIASISKKYGAQVPFYRSAKNSDDKATIVDVIKEVISQYKKRKQEFEYFCCIYPTAPFITAQLLRKGYRIIRTKDVDSTFPLVRYSYPIQRAFIIKNGYIRMKNPKNINVHSQDLTPTYHDCGQFCFVKTKAFLKKGVILSNKVFPIIISELETQDIDNLEDWKIAEIKYKILKEIKKSSYGSSI